MASFGDLSELEHDACDIVSEKQCKDLDLKSKVHDLEKKLFALERKRQAHGVFLMGLCLVLLTVLGLAVGAMSLGSRGNMSVQ